LTIFEKSPAADLKYELSCLKSLEIDIVTGEYVKYTADFIGRQGNPATSTVTFVESEAEFTSKYCQLKMAANKAGLAAAPRVSIKSAKVKIERNTEAYYEAGSVTPAEIHNKAFDVSFECERRYSDNTLKDASLKNTKYALELSMVNTDDKIGTAKDENPSLKFTLPAVVISEWERDVARIAPPAPRRRTGAGWAGRISVLTVLGLVTVIAPISTRVSPSPLASAALNTQSETPAPEASAPASSVAAAVLGSDADVDSPSDSDLSNVPDAATRTRIREARENAVVTCSPQTGGASGDTSAFNKAPEIFFPMISDTYTVSSPYGYRLHPTLGYMKLHAGQDFAAPVGTPIYAAAAGKVVFAGMDDGAGTVTIEHQIDGQTWYTSYLHMYEDGIYVKVGDTVTAGQLIAGVGNTGRSSGSHLHFEVRTKNDTADESTVDPEKWLEDHHAAELSTDCT